MSDFKSDQKRGLSRKKRETLSCNPCRKRKRKCDHGTPCSNCVKLNIEATCDYGSNSRWEENKKDKEKEIKSPTFVPQTNLDFLANTSTVLEIIHQFEKHMPIQTAPNNNPLSIFSYKTEEQEGAIANEPLPKNISDMLIENYRRLVDPFFPVIDWKEFEEHYENLYPGQAGPTPPSPPQPPSFLALIYTVYALSCKSCAFDSQLHTLHTSAVIHFSDRAEQYLNRIPLLVTSSIDDFRAALLYIYSSFSGDCLMVGWSLCGLLVTMSQRILPPFTASDDLKEAANHLISVSGTFFDACQEFVGHKSGLEYPLLSFDSYPYLQTTQKLHVFTRALQNGQAVVDPAELLQFDQIINSLPHNDPADYVKKLALTTQWYKANLLLFRCGKIDRQSGLVFLLKLLENQLYLYAAPPQIQQYILFHWNNIYYHVFTAVVMLALELDTVDPLPSLDPVVFPNLSKLHLEDDNHWKANMLAVLRDQYFDLRVNSECASARAHMITSAFLAQDTHMECPKPFGPFRKMLCLPSGVCICRFDKSYFQCGYGMELDRQIGRALYDSKESSKVFL
ncbi:hypothetical protein CJU90_2378 [Yarrowia sp. C11]|nr:hypothetical protein CJU90_2378 [Yarrowia sp. C11]